MMEQIQIKLKSIVDNSYELSIGTDLFEKIADQVLESGIKNIAVITDSNIKDLYGNALLNLLKEKGLNSIMVAFSAGESSKIRSTKEKIEDLLIQSEFKRDSMIIALGGGVTGDLAGFIAATYMRGIPYIQVPTSLLAMVDSSIGGKTGVDTKDGKNLIGAFHQPNAVFIDVKLLRTLPKEEIINGLAEMIKHAIIKDFRYFEFLSKNLEKIIDLDLEVLVKAIKWSSIIKKEFVERDERESNLRKALNLGHTIGHAIEKTLDYRIKHGQAVALGILVETKIAMEKGIINTKDCQMISDLIKRLNIGKIAADPKKILENTKYDKKMIGGELRYVFPKRIGTVDTDVAVTDELVLTALGEII